MHKIFVVDAFADAPFTGNPAAVCLLEHDVDEKWMQSLAEEMKHAETAFLTRDMGLRWFTPTVEVDLCGHATLAAAHVLDRDSVTFSTKSGDLTCVRDGEVIRMDFPTTPAKECDPPMGLLEALRIDKVTFCGISAYDYLLEVESEAALHRIQPNYEALKEIGARGHIVTTRGKDYDFVSRFFAPAAGVDEDPVTGSAHCALAPYWAAKLGKSDMRAYQASPRGGKVFVGYHGERTQLAGCSVTVLSGTLA
jgi:predicted PhzF superfamily epimerase YddE/YHI9